jgi:hypothetical protein
MIQAIIHIYMEMSQGQCWYSFLKQTKMSFLKIKLENRREEQVLSGGVGTSGKGKM